MRFKKALKIPIYIYNESELELQDIGLGGNGGFSETELSAFWCIDCASPHSKEPDKTTFYVNGESFVTCYPFEEFVKLVDRFLND